MFLVIYIRYNKYCPLFFVNMVFFMMAFILFLFSFSNINGWKSIRSLEFLILITKYEQIDCPSSRKKLSSEKLSYIVEK